MVGFGAPGWVAGPSVSIQVSCPFPGIMGGAPSAGNRRRSVGNQWCLEGNREHSILSVTEACPSFFVPLQTASVRG